MGLAASRLRGYSFCSRNWAGQSRFVELAVLERIRLPLIGSVALSWYNREYWSGKR